MQNIVELIGGFRFLVTSNAQYNLMNCLVFEILYRIVTEDVHGAYPLYSNKKYWNILPSI